MVPSDLSKNICVIGAGASGLCALKTITQTPQYKSGQWKVVAFESRDAIGGVWYPAPPTGNPPVTALYDSLTTNLPHPLMCFPNFPFPPETPVFPPAKHVHSYLQAFGNHHNLEPLVRLSTTVKNVKYVADTWQVRFTSTVLPGLVQCQKFDHVILCAGRYNLPRYPDTPGLAKWLAEGKASHSAWYRKPNFLGDKVLVLGDGPSANDIVAEMATVTKLVIRSVPQVSSSFPTRLRNVESRGMIKEFKSDLRTVVFEDGRVETDIDHCFLGTGYRLSWSFLDESVLKVANVLPTLDGIPNETYNSSYHVFPLAEHIFPINREFPPTSLAFMGIPFRVIPFPLFEAQAQYIVAHIGNSSLFDTQKENAALLDFYEARRSEFGENPLAIAKSWHTAYRGEQFEYRDRLYAFVSPEKRNMTEQWERDAFRDKAELKRTWNDLERTGEAANWLRGVGMGEGESVKKEWVKLLKRLEKRTKATLKPSPSAQMILEQPMERAKL